MITQDLISDNIPPILPNDTVDKALNWMMEFHTDQLVLIDDRKYIGIVTEDELLEIHDDKSAINTIPQTFIRPFVYDNSHLFNALDLFDVHQLTILPVLDKDDNYIGNISLRSIVNYFASMFSTQNPGGILTLEMDSRDYSLTEISKIVESCEASILTCSVKNIQNSRNIDVTLKINKTELTDLISTFERFEYVVKHTFQESVYNDLLKDRYESFMNYLDI